MRRELTAEHRDSIRKLDFDVLNHGTTSEMTVRLQSLQDNDLLSQVRREELINALYKKAEDMNQAEVKILQDIMNEANRKDSRLLRNEFKSALKDIAGIMRAANPFFTNSQIDASGFKGFGREYDLSKISMKTAVNANIGDFADMIAADRSLAKKKLQQALIDTFSDATRRAEKEVTDDAYRALKKIEPSIP